MADQPAGGGGGGLMIREYRKGNWTITETMVLIEAKKMNDERRTKRTNGGGGGGGGSSSTNNKVGELRWKWVEDYCWRKGCFRSQNQCNDKWDNLMRDYKKVRDHQRRLLPESAAPAADDATTANNIKSYWKLDKNERKDRNLPSNMLRQIYDALVDVVERPSSSAGGDHPRLTASSVAGGSNAGIPTSGSSFNKPPPPPPLPSPTLGDVTMEISTAAAVLNRHQPHPPPPTAAAAGVMPSPVMTSHRLQACPPFTLLSLPSPPPVQAAPPLSQSQLRLAPPPPLVTYPLHHHPVPTMCDAVGLDSEDDSEETSGGDYSDSPAKRRRMSSPGGEAMAAASMPEAEAAGSNNNEVGRAISRSAATIAEAIQAGEEKEERRHRDMVSLQERRLKIEESKMEIARHGINGLVDAINSLSHSILALASSSSTSSRNDDDNRNQQPSAPPPK